MKKKAILCCMVSVMFVLGTMTLIYSPASAVSFTSYTSYADFEAALGGASTITQDFESYSPGDDLYGVEILPGVNVTSNLAEVLAWGSPPDISLFGLDRWDLELGEKAHYDINFTLTYYAAGFYIEAWELYPAVGSGSSADGYVEMDFYGGDSSSMFFPKPEGDPVFFGIIADTPITRISWFEPLEDESDRPEETTLDDFIVATAPVPEPSTVLLLGAGLIGLAAFRRKFNKR